MTNFRLKLRLDGETHSRMFGAEDLDAAIETAEEIAQEWVEEGDWGDEGAVVTVHYQLFASDDLDEEDEEDDEPEWEDSIDVEIEPDHRRLILAAGGDPRCDHEWTAAGEGGCDENPGVWSSGGTSITTRRHCRLCGLRRTYRETGHQRNPGDHDTVEYEQPESWCADCESDDCTCDEVED